MWKIKFYLNNKLLKESETARPKKAQAVAKEFILEILSKEHQDILYLLQEDKIIDAIALLEYKTHHRVEIYYE